MASFGEGTVQVNSRIVGHVHVSDVHHGRAEYPRITFRLTVQLQELPSDGIVPGPQPLAGFELRDLRGELRLAENDRTIGTVQWIGPRRHVRSAPYVSDGQVDVACDLDLARLERIEAHRNGGEAILFLALWPTLVRAGEFLDAEIGTIHLSIPRDRWLALLDALAKVRHELIEVPYPPSVGEAFTTALAHLKEATGRIDRGDYDEAVAACRRAIEATATALGIKNQSDALQATLAQHVDIKRAKAYAGIVTKIKELGNFTIHRAEAAGTYSRAEARFAVGTAHHVITLLAFLCDSSK